MNQCNVSINYIIIWKKNLVADSFVGSHEIEMWHG